jgi:L-threonylcarbamoyladenylate synthase
MAEPSTTTQIVDDGPAGIARAAAVIRAGGLVAFPTETVYGLGADATSDAAVAAIFQAKGRPHFNPLIVHVADMEEARRLAYLDGRAEALAAAAWPGPLTLVLPRRPDSGLSLLASAGLDTVALRAPALPAARRLIAAAGRPIAAPSANRSGRISPTDPRAVMEELGGIIPLILAGGRTPIGIESTVVDLSGPRAVLLRPGGMTAEDLEALAGPLAEPGGDEAAPRSPGRLERHYAPAARLRLDAARPEAGEAFLAFGPTRVRGAAVLNLSPEGDLAEAAANLFRMLRALDQDAPGAIAVAPIPPRGLGLAINDRLRRAAAGR